jgi:NADH:ubiquinone oxidoreductase subunit 5 (subunit L)/multisubunit Na+/H+ antiporter MnhA subunit
MDFVQLVEAAGAVGPIALMLLALVLFQRPAMANARLWTGFNALSVAALACSVLAAFAPVSFPDEHPWLITTPLGAGLSILVQFLGTVIGGFSARYLQGEARQRRYVTALAGVLAAVHLLLMADHWVVLIAAWALVGIALQALLCFYPDRPFALLAAHKKRMADRLADVLLIVAAILAWSSAGSGSFTDLTAQLEREGMSFALHASAVLLVLAVILRTALLPVHGWLIQVMEAPTPVSALLHAGVVNLGGFVLIRFAPLLEQATLARWLLVAFGLGTAVLAGLVMLTRISIKVRLAWSTVAQMGFMVLECGLGLYTLAALHLVGHSLYKAHAFLSASMAVRQARLQTMRGKQSPARLSLWLAPAVAVTTVLLVQTAMSPGAWPWWWSALLGLAWAPLLWLPARSALTDRSTTRGIFSGLLMIAGLTVAAVLAHALPMGLRDAPEPILGVVALVGMGALYLCLGLLQSRPRALDTWRRWSYAGFYLDEFYTRLALWLWPARWTPDSSHAIAPVSMTRAAVDVPQAAPARTTP